MTLTGIRVIDFGQYVAGPLAAVMLADQGAEVIHIDPPGGPRWQSDADAFYNRGKQRIALDLKQADGCAIASRLIHTADVVIENFRPGVMDRLGLGPGRMTDLVPTLIYCSVPGFASDDPRANLAAWEGVVGAATQVWETRLRAAGVGAHAIARVEDLMEDPWVRSHGLSLTQTTVGVGDMTMPGVAARLSRTPLRVGKPVRPVGSDAAEILGDLGMAADLDDLVREGALGFSLTPPAPLARI